MARKAHSPAALSAAQRLYATWDAATLRLAWTGADWNTAGDLFIYLDTLPGQGAHEAMNPYPGDTNRIFMPGTTPDSVGASSLGLHSASLETTQALRQSRLLLNGQPMGADYLVWVQDESTAWLYRYSGGVWGAPTQLTTEQYRFDGGLRHGLTDLSLPFASIGLSSGGALEMVALAVEEGALRAWAAMPPENPLSSGKAAKTTPGTGKAGSFGLTQSYEWAALGLGLCPNGSAPAILGGPAVSGGPDLKADQPQYPDSPLNLSITAEPAGSAYGYVRDGLFWLWGDLFGSQRPLELSESFDFMDTEHPPLGDGDTITFLIEATNEGTEAATNVTADLAAYYALRLLDGASQQTQALLVSLGTILPGQTVSRTVTGVVNLAAARTQDYGPCMVTHPDDPAFCERYLHWASLDCKFYDSAHGTDPLEWFWVDHPVDPMAPLFYGIAQPTYAIATGVNHMTGWAYDNSRVARLDLEIAPPSGGVETVNCWECAPQAGAWSYNWTVPAPSGEPQAHDVSEAANATYSVRVRAVDEYDQVGAWTNWRTFLVDSQAPTLTLDAIYADAVNGRTLPAGPDQLSGTLLDNLDASRVEACVDGDCQPAAVRLTAVLPVVIENTTARAVSTCPTCVEVSFVVTQSLSIGDISLGFNAAHPYRDDLVVELVSPGQAKRVRVLAGEGSVLGTHANYDVLLRDAAPSGLYDARGDDDPVAPYYDRICRPYQPLSAFLGDNAQGTWTLRICDDDGSQHAGTYSRARLSLTPANSGPKTGAWTYALPQAMRTREGQQTVTLYGYDAVGNRSDPLTVSYTIDRQAPTLNVVSLTGDIPSGDAAAVITGTVADAGEVTRMFLFIEGPDGAQWSDRPTWGLGVLGAEAASDAELDLAASGGWGYSLQPAGEGLHRLWIQAEDVAGNLAEIGPYEVNVSAPGPLPTPSGSPTPRVLPVKVTLVSDVDTFCPGWTLRYTFAVTNTSQAALTNLVIADVLPPDTCCVTDDPSNPVAGVIAPDDNAITWRLAQLVPGQVVVFHVSLHSFTSLTDESEINNQITLACDQLGEPAVFGLPLEVDLALCGLLPTPTPTPTVRITSTGQVFLPLLLKGYQSPGGSALDGLAPTALPVVSPTPSATAWFPLLVAPTPAPLQTSRPERTEH